MIICRTISNLEIWPNRKMICRTWQSQERNEKQPSANGLSTFGLTDEPMCSTTSDCSISWEKEMNSSFLHVNSSLPCAIRTSSDVMILSFVFIPYDRIVLLAPRLCLTGWSMQNSFKIIEQFSWTDFFHWSSIIVSAVRLRLLLTLTEELTGHRQG